MSAKPHTTQGPSQSNVNWLQWLATFRDKYPQNPHKWLQDRTWDSPRREEEHAGTEQAKRSRSLRRSTDPKLPKLIQGYLAHKKQRPRRTLQ